MQNGHPGVYGTNIDEVIDNNMKQNVLVVTVAFGKSADPNIESLAEPTNGAAFFAPDGWGPGLLNEAFHDLME